MEHFKCILYFAISLTLLGCGHYSFTGASISPETKTFQVNYFQNNALLIEPGLDRDFTQSLQNLLLKSELMFFSY